MSPLVGMILGLVVLVLLYMARPHFDELELSAARFFANVKSKARPPRRFNLSLPIRSWPLYAQLVVGGLVAASMGTGGCQKDAYRLGLWVMLDTSSSMTTAHSKGGQRFEAAQRAVWGYLERARKRAEGPLCMRLSVFDEDVRTIVDETTELREVRVALEALTPEDRGTDLNGVRQVLRQRTGPDAVDATPSEGESVDGRVEACHFTHRLVVTDQPAPDWVVQPREGDGGVTVIWRDVGEVVENTGITALRPEREPFSARVRAVEVEVAAYGGTPPAVELKVVMPETVVSEQVDWLEIGRWRHRIAVDRPGEYRLRLVPGGAYAGDDTATFEVPAASGLRVDWRVSAPWIVERFGWRHDPERPQLRVVPLGDPVIGGANDKTPLLVLGPGLYGRGPRSELLYFDGASELLDEVNLDVVEEARIAHAPLPKGFRQVVTGRTWDEVWLADRAEPPGVYLPGLPTWEDNPQGRLSATLFANALRRLLITARMQLDEESQRIAYLAAEGRTGSPPRSHNSDDDMKPQPIREREPWWPWLLLASILVFTLDQVLLGWWRVWS